MRTDRERRRRREPSPRPPGLVDRLRGSRRTVWLSAVGVVILVWLLSGFLLRGLNSGEVLDGTSMSGIELGGQTREGAAEAITGIKPLTLELSGAGQSVTVRAPQAGLVIDPERSAERAWSSGRSGIVAILKGPLVRFTDRELEPVYVSVKRKRLARTVDRIADRLDRETFVGALLIDRETFKVAAEQPKAGVRIRRGLAREQILEAFLAGRAAIDLPVRRQPAPKPAEVEAVAREAQRYLRKPLRIRTAGDNTTFAPKQMAGVLTVETTGDDLDAGIRLGADADKVRSLVAKFAGRRDRPARDARLDTPAQPPVTLSEQGDLTWSPKPGVATVKGARKGRQIRQNQAVDATIGAVRNGKHRVRFATEPVKPNMTNDMVKNATSLLGTFTTSYSCCEPRVTNIQRMAKTVDGTVIGPGEQFSLNGIAGERTEANGYKPAPTIGENNELIDTVGGGVSQFSTTTYNAAYFAGLQVDAHTAHSFYISRYPPGREATLNWGSIDLLWTNDTKGAVVVRSSASDTAVTVSIYGGNGGRRVRAKTQSRSGNDHGGFDMTVDRVIIDGDGSRRTDSFTTIYGLPAD